MPAKTKTTLVTVMAVLLLTFGTTGHANTVEEKPSAMAMVGDALLVRPAMLAVTVVGSVVYTVSLPFSLMGGNASEAGQTLVVGPSKATFVRCLGCTTSGRKSTAVVVEEEERR